MLYKINSIERKTTSKGSAKADLTLIDVSGAEFEGVTIWADFPNFEGLAAGSQIDGNLSIKQNGQYTNKTLYPNTAKPTANGQIGGNKSALGAGMMKQKAENIERAQETKAEGIMMSSTIRMAVDITVAKMGGKMLTDEEIKNEVTKWRYWLVEKWPNLSPIKVAGGDYPENNQDNPPF